MHRIMLVAAALAFAGQASAAVPLKGDPRICSWSTNATKCVRDSVPVALQKHNVEGAMDCIASRQFLYRCTVRNGAGTFLYTVEFVQKPKQWRTVVTQR